MAKPKGPGGVAPKEEGAKPEPSSSSKWAEVAAKVAPALVAGLVGGGISGGGILALQRLTHSSDFVIQSGYTNFNPNSAWTDSPTIRGWRESFTDIRFRRTAPCRRPRVHTAISSLDLQGDGTAIPRTRVDVAVIEDQPTAEGFRLFARTWGGAADLPWVKVEWIALCPVQDDR